MDRAGTRRTDPEWVAAVRAHPDARSVLMWRDGCLVDDTPVRVHPAELEDPVLLGVDGEAGVFAADLSTLDEADAIRVAGATAVVDIRRLFPSLPAQQSATLAYARGILHWNRSQRFCGACGSPTASRDAGHLRVCSGCGKPHFPRIEPAVIVLVEAAGKRCLLARHKGAAPGAYSTLAGFVET